MIARRDFQRLDIFCHDNQEEEREKERERQSFPRAVENSMQAEPSNASNRFIFVAKCESRNFIHSWIIYPLIIRWRNLSLNDLTTFIFIFSFNR